MIVEFVKFDIYARDLAAGIHAGALNADGNTLAIFLTNDPVDRALHAVKADLTEIGIGNGYDGPIDTQNASSRVDGVIYVAGTDILLIGTGPGSFGPFQYAVLYNQTPMSEPLIGYWNYGTPISVSMGEQFAINFGSAMLMVG